MDPEKKLVRIKPSNNREVYVGQGVTIRKVDGWCIVPGYIADQLAKERMSERYPESSPPVFDVQTQEEAREIVAAEDLKVDPAGTVENPKEKIVRELDPPDEPRTRGGRGR